jgi:hypothetical protein
MYVGERCIFKGTFSLKRFSFSERTLLHGASKYAELSFLCYIFSPFGGNFVTFIIPETPLVVNPNPSGVLTVMSTSRGGIVDRTKALTVGCQQMAE